MAAWVALLPLCGASCTEAGAGSYAGDFKDERIAVELPSGYTDAWVNARGEYVITENPSFNPNVELDGGWRKLEKRSLERSWIHVMGRRGGRRRFVALSSEARL